MLTAEIAQYLDDTAGLVTFDTTGRTGNCFIETLPDKPNTAVAVYASGGAPGDLATKLDRPSIQLIVRAGSDPRTAAALAQNIYNALHGLHDVTLITSGTRVMLCTGVQSGPVGLGTDSNGRQRYALNFDLLTINEGR